VEAMANWPSSPTQIDRGIPIFLDQLVEELKNASSQTTGLSQTAVKHGQDLFLQGFTVSQVVHDYGNVCQSVTDMAVERSVSISSDDFRTLNRCLDDAIAIAVTEYTRHQQLSGHDQSHELRGLINTAIAAFEVVQSGNVGVKGMTGALVRQSLLDIRTCVESRFGLPAGQG
jgi:hypothetical protein